MYNQTAMNVHVNGSRSCNWTASNASKHFCNFYWYKCIDLYISFKKICRLRTMYDIKRNLHYKWITLQHISSTCMNGLTHFRTDVTFLVGWNWTFFFYSRLVCNLLEKLTSTISFSAYWYASKKLYPMGKTLKNFIWCIRV